MFEVVLPMSFQALNHPSQVLSFVNTPRKLYKSYKTRLYQVQAVPPSSIILNEDESGKFPDSRKLCGSSIASVRSESAIPLVSQASSVGIIGGISVNSTLKFLRKLVELNLEDGENSLPFVLCSDPVLSEELLTYEKSYLLSGRGKAESVKLDTPPIVQNLRNKRVFLEHSGARCVVMPCHVSHSWYEEVSKGCSVPFLHMGECVAKELREAKLKPLEAGSPLRIGVLATNATLAAGFYQEKLQNEVKFCCTLRLLMFF